MQPDQPEPRFEVTSQPCGAGGRVAVTVKAPDGTSYTDRVSVTDATKRAAFVTRMLERFPGLLLEELEQNLERMAADAVEAVGTTRDSEASQATLIVSMVESDPSIELFHTGGGQDAVAYVSLLIDGHRETRPLRSQGTRQWIARMFYVATGTVPGGAALTDALNTLGGKAAFEGEARQVHIRIAELDGEIWVDLGDPSWRAARVTAQGWSVETDIPVRFIRRGGMQALPVPTFGGRIEDLLDLVNLQDEGQKILAVSWVVAALRPNRPCPVLNITGEQGSAKSTLCKMLREMVDPSRPMLRRPPSADRDLMIAASNSWVAAFDNLSAISDGLSDSLCSLATGGGFATRSLYTDDDERIFEAMRPVIVNGIDDAVTRPDLLDRCVSLHLKTISKEQRRDEDALWSEFRRRQPGILGALLNAVSVALRNIGSVRLESKPRMADFAMWVVAAEPALPWARGAFLTAYLENRDQANGLALESSAIGAAVLVMMNTIESWEGTATNLLEALVPYTSDRTRARSDWPKSARRASGDLRRVAPNLRAVGIDVVVGERDGHDRRRLIRLVRQPGTPSASSAPSAEPGVRAADLASPGIDGPDTAVRWVPADDADGADGVLRGSSEGGES